MKLIDATECPWGFNGNFGCEEVGVYVMLKEPITLQLRIRTESGVALPRMIGDGETLDSLLEMAWDGADAENDLPGIILLRDCLLKWANRIGEIIENNARSSNHPKTTV
jgi:hypothetical protein